jgi:tetratricopeptide (TPR) repeat protein
MHITDTLQQLGVKYQIDIASVRSDAIQSLETIYSQFKDYARGSARQTLYEAYMARGRAYDASGQYDLEQRDFQRAAQIAQESPGSILRLFESQVSVANTMSKLGYYKDAVQIYQSAVEMSGIRGRTSSHQSQLLSQLDRADSLVAGGSYQAASRIYRDSLANITELYSTQTAQINSVEDLIKYTNQYNSTLEAILVANGWSQSDLSQISGEIQIPYLP